MYCSSSSGGSRRKAKQKTLPRLERWNANNNINYEFGPYAPSSSSSYYSSVDSSLRTRSLELYSDKKSFRVAGMDGEIEIICNALGFSGVDDFGISPAEYESMKFRSSSSPLLLNRKFEADTAVITDDDVARGIGNSISWVADNPSVSGPDDESGDTIRESDEILSENVTTGLNECGGNGINGVRPSLIVPVLETKYSAWGLHLEGESVSSVVVNLEDEEGKEGHVEQEEDREEDNTNRLVIRSANCEMSASPPFTASDKPTSSISPDWRFRRIITGWQKGELLGRGSFGSVYEGISDGGFFFAVKEVSLLDQGDEGKQSIIQLEQEIALLSQFQHENIVQYYGATKDESNLYIFLELVSLGSLLSRYQKYNLQDSQVSVYARQILHGLKYLHDKGVVHRDIKCSNILVDTSGSVKLADFGLAKATKLNDVKSCKGTAFWMAPEVVRSKGYGHAADIWSLGCTVLEMLTRRFPYFNLEYMAAIFKIGKGERPPIPESLSSYARDFILQCLQVDPNARPSAAQLLDHPFVKRTDTLSSNAISPHNFGWRNQET